MAGSKVPDPAFGGPPRSLLFSAQDIRIALFDNLSELKARTNGCEQHRAQSTVTSLGECGSTDSRKENSNQPHS